MGDFSTIIIITKILVISTNKLKIYEYYLISVYFGPRCAQIGRLLRKGQGLSENLRGSFPRRSKESDCKNFNI